MVNYDAIINIINEITKVNSAPCKKTLQKIVFLIEAKGEDLGCDHGIHFYGPYSSDLDFAIRELNEDGVVDIEYTSLEHKISISQETEIPNYNNATVSSVIDNFAKETASELELIATALYVYLSANKDISKIMAGVTKIKGCKYSETRITDAIQKLQKNGFIAA